VSFLARQYINIFYFQYTSIIPVIESPVHYIQTEQFLGCFPLFMTKYFQVRITALECSEYFLIFGSPNLRFLQPLRFLEGVPILIYVTVNSNTPSNNDSRGKVNNNPRQ
jgi:hypothetical protein